MSYELTKIITAMIMPPFSIILIMIISLILLAFGWKKLAYSCLTLGIIVLYIVSIPYTANKLTNSLITEDNLSLDDYKQAQAIVILGGGLRDSKEIYAKLTTTGPQMERVRYGAYLHKMTGLPILTSGATSNGLSEAEIIAEELAMFFNIPTKWIDSDAKTTKENAIYSAKILFPQNIKKIIVVTHEWHMQRAKMLYEREGFEVLPASAGGGLMPASYHYNYNYFIPQASALFMNMLTLKEWLGYWKEKYF